MTLVMRAVERVKDMMEYESQAGTGIHTMPLDQSNSVLGQVPTETTHEKGKQRRTTTEIQQHTISTHQRSPQKSQ